MTAATPGAIPGAVLASLKAGGEITVQEIREAHDLSKRQAYNAINRLETRGFLRWIRKYTWKVTDTGVQAAIDGFEFGPGSYGPIGNVRQPKNSLRQRAWAAMRVRHSFTIGDIIADAGRGDEKREYENLNRYIRELRRAGVLGELPRREKGTAIGSNGFKRFILLKNLGPKAPAYRASVKAIHDFNTGEDIPCDRA